MGAKMRQWALLEKVYQRFQQANLAIKYSPMPVVVAPVGRVLGGGCEIVMHGQQVRAAAETYIGLVEVGAGADPGWRRLQGAAGALAGDDATSRDRSRARATSSRSWRWRRWRRAPTTR